MFTHAIVRSPCRNFSAGLTSSKLGAANFDAMQSQHAAYVEALRDAGLAVQVLPAADDFPDAHFVEDVAIVVPELAVITRPGAPSRRGETELMRAALAPHRVLAGIEAPGTLDGGDVLQVGEHVIAGLSARSNAEGARQLAEALRPHGYRTTTIEVPDSLHFKSDVNWAGGRTLVVTPAFSRCEALDGYELIVVSPEELYAANCLRVNDKLLIAAGFPSTAARLSKLDARLVPLDTSECRKMDGGLTCMSLRF